MLVLSRSKRPLGAEKGQTEFHPPPRLGDGSPSRDTSSLPDASKPPFLDFSNALRGISKRARSVPPFYLSSAPFLRPSSSSTSTSRIDLAPLWPAFTHITQDSGVLGYALKYCRSRGWGAEGSRTASHQARRRGGDQKVSEMFFAGRGYYVCLVARGAGKGRLQVWGGRMRGVKR